MYNNILVVAPYPENETIREYHDVQGITYCNPIVRASLALRDAVSEWYPNVSEDAQKTREELIRRRNLILDVVTSHHVRLVVLGKLTYPTDMLKDSLLGHGVVVMTASEFKNDPNLISD